MYLHSSQKQPQVMDDGATCATALGSLPTTALIDTVNLGQRLDRMSLSSYSVAGSITFPGLNAWDPWTGGRRLPNKSTKKQRVTQQALKTESASRGDYQKAAGRIGDVILQEERRASTATFNRIGKPGLGRLNANNNTSEMAISGLRDVQRHGKGARGQHTTVITRLASEMTTGGGVLDVNFVMDSNSSNTTISENTMESSGTDDWRWMQDFSVNTDKQPGANPGQPDDAAGGGGGGEGLPAGQFEQQAGKQPRRRRATGSKKGAAPSSELPTSLLETETAEGGVGEQQKQKRKKKQGKKVVDADASDQAINDNQEDVNGGLVTDTADAGGEGDGEGGDDDEEDDDAEEEGMDEEEGEGESGSDEMEEAAPASEEKSSQMAARKKLNISHLQKEGVIIGCMNVFADVMKKEFTVLLTDSVVEAFLLEPSQFRAIARRTGCEIEVTRRILNKRIGLHRWVKYLVITIKGPNMTAIDQCDRLMVKVFPPYKIRKEYLEAAPVALFVKESYPDNTQLYFNFQRTGPTADRLGDMRLQTPFGPSDSRPLENTPWKYADQRLFRGVLEPRNLAAEHTMQHVYPEWGTEPSNYLDKGYKWELAGDAALDLERRKNLERSVRVKNRKMEAEPLFAENT